MKRVYVYSLPQNGTELTVTGSHVVDAYFTPIGLQVSVEAADDAEYTQAVLMVVNSGYGYSDEWTAVKTVVEPGTNYVHHVLAKNVTERPRFLKR